MATEPVPTPEETARLEALHSYDVLDTEPEPDLDGLAAVACAIFGVPIACISLVDADRQWFKARIGLAVCETPREHAFCDHSIRQPDRVMVVEDALADPRFAGNPLVTGEPHIRFYAGAPLVNSAGHALGTLCVIDVEPRRPNVAQTDALLVLAESVTRALELRRTLRQLRDHQAERLLLTEQLTHRDNTLSALLQNLPGMAYRGMLDENWTITFASPGSTALTGYDPDELVDNARVSFAALVLDEDREATEDAFFQALERRRPYRLNFRIRHRNGSIRWVMEQGSWVFDDSGRAIGSQGIITDITPLKHSEAELTQRRDFAERLLEKLTAPAFVLDPEGYVMYWNSALEELTGCPAERMLGTRDHPRAFYRHDRPCLADLVLGRYDGDTSSLFAGIARSRLSPDGLQGQGWCDMPNGRRCYIECHAAPVRSSTGALVAVVETLHDLTERELLGRQVIEARDTALEAGRAKSAFLANMSHEIRTPMNGVLGMLELLDRTQLDAAQRDMCRTAQSAASSLMTLLNEVLDFSKIEAGKIRLERVEFDPWVLLEEVSAIHATRASEKGIELHLDITEALPGIVIGDPTRLRQVLNNLLSNATKFTERGEILVAVLPDATESHTAFRFEITDTGIGMTPETLSRLFQPFVQADASTTRRFGGTGLGLSIARELLQLMGSDLEARSIQGVGTAFRFRLALEAGGRQSSTPEELRGKHALLAMRNERALLLLRRRLEHWGMTVEVAATATEALALLRSAAMQALLPGVALIDMDLPEGGADRLARWMTSDPALSGVARVLVGKPATFDESLSVAAVLAKPVQRLSLIRALGKALGVRVGGLRHTAPIARRAIPAFPNVSVLLVEDNRVNRDVARGMLAHFGLTPDVAVDGREAVVATATLRYDLVFMDCQMPVLDGYAATAAIREREAKSNTSRRVPIVALTANIRQEDLERCLAAGMDDHIAKPLSMSALAAVLERWLGPGTRSVTATEAEPPAIDAATDPTLCIDTLERLREVAADNMTEFVAVFKQESRDLVQAIRQASDESECEVVYRAAHSLKSASAYFGALRLSELSATVERLAREGRTTDVQAHLPRLERALTEAHSALVKAIASH